MTAPGRRGAGKVSLAGFVALWLFGGILRQIGFDARSGYTGQRQRSSRQWVQSRAPRPVKWFLRADEMLTQLGKRAALHAWKTTSNGARNGIREGKARHVEHLELKEFPKGTAGYQAVRDRHRQARIDRRNEQRVAAGLPPRKPVTSPEPVKAVHREPGSTGSSDGRSYQVRCGPDVFVNLSKSDAEVYAADWTNKGFRGVKVEPMPGTTPANGPVSDNGTARPEPTTTPDGRTLIPPPANPSPPSAEFKETQEKWRKRLDARREAARAQEATTGPSNGNDKTGSNGGNMPNITPSAGNSNNGGGSNMTSFGEVTNVQMLKDVLQAHVAQHAAEASDSTGATVEEDVAHYQAHASGLETASANMASSPGVVAAIQPVRDALHAAMEASRRAKADLVSHADNVRAAAEGAIAALAKFDGLSEHANTDGAGTDLRTFQNA